MNWLNKLERKIGRYAVPNLIIWLIGAYTIGYVFGTVSPGILSYLTLSPYHILHGQIWRLVTWVFMPTESNLIFLLIMALFYYQLGMALERTWGTFRFNVYIFGGMIFTVIGAFVLYGIYYAMNASVISQMPALAAQLCEEIPDLPFPAYFTDIGQIFQSDAVGPVFVDGKDMDSVLTEATDKAQKQLEFLRNE